MKVASGLVSGPQPTADLAAAAVRDALRAAGLERADSVLLFLTRDYMRPVSYTHLDVYKRQLQHHALARHGNSEQADGQQEDRTGFRNSGGKFPPKNCVCTGGRVH